MNPLLSIIVPVYNIMEYLPRCVESICRQTYSNLEIILVDDGSTDGTGPLCDQLAKQDERIRVYHKENGGTSTARNLGLEKACGQYIGFVDSDDYISETAYEVMVRALEREQQRNPLVGIAQNGRDEIDEDGRLLPAICFPPEESQLISSEDFMIELLMHRGDCSFCTKLVRRDLFEGKQFPVGKLNEDFLLLIQILEETPGVVSNPDITYHVFYKSESNSRKRDKENFSRVFADCVDNADFVEDLCGKNHRELLKYARRFGVFQRLEYLLHVPISQMKRDNVFYRKKVVAYLRKHWIRDLKNPYLTRKNKVYMMLFVIAPRKIRQLHKHFILRKH